MTNLYSPKNEVELAIIKSILDGASIPYFVHNDHFGSWKTGPQIELLNKKILMVDEEYVGQAKELISAYLQVTTADNTTNCSEYSPFDKMRMIFEFLLFGWFMPGKKSSKQKEKDR